VKKGVSEAGSVSAFANGGCVEKLAHVFRNALPMRLPVTVSGPISGGRELREETVIEFGTPREVLFATRLPVEFEDQVRLVNSDGSFEVRAVVVAVRYHGSKKAVAARFVEEVKNWIIKP